MEKFHVIGVMSGTSLDGIDFAEIVFEHKDNQWSFQLNQCTTYAYPKKWILKLSDAVDFNETALKELDKEYTRYLASEINKFITEFNIKNIDAVCSHGHTILHQPKKGITLQIGNLPEISELTNQKVVCDFRVQDVQLGGQGAPLVPIGDELLFGDFDYCLNLGGFSNVSFKANDNRFAYDICAVNVVLNHYVNKLGFSFDKDGENAQKGVINFELLEDLNRIPFYKKTYPKSLGIEWVKSIIFPLIDSYNISEQDILRTYVEHIAQIISKDLKLKKEEKLLLTGGGAFNNFFVQKLKAYCEGQIIIPQKSIVEFKEALIFGLLGVLRLKNEINTLSSVTGAEKDHCSGKVYS